MVINRSNIPLPEEVYNPQSGAKAFGDAFYQSLVGEINAAKLARAKEQERAYGVLKEMASSKYYEATEPLDWQNALKNPAAEMAKFKRVAPVEEQMIDMPVYQQGATGGVEQVVDPATGKPLTYKGKPGTIPEIISRPPQGAQAELGEQDFYKMSPQEQQAAIRIAKGDDMIEKYSTRGKLKDKLQFGAQQWAEANGIPYNNYIAQNRATTLTDFSKGNAARNIRSLNTVTGHLGDLKEVAKSSGNSKYVMLNKLANWYKKQTGNPAPAETGLTINAVVGELASVFKNSGATNEEIANLKKDIDINSSPEQFDKWVERAVHLMKSRMDALDEQWQQAFTGTGKTFQALNPKSQALLKRMGFDINGTLGADVAQPAQSVGLTVGTIEDGYRYKGGNPADPNSWEAVQ